jgi:hypothetical protein
MMDRREIIPRWAQTWKEAGPELEAIRLQEIPEAGNRKVLAMLEGAFHHALRTMPPRQSWGLAEMQHWFAMLRR